MPICAVCSGCDFICESGYYYCSECQTQTQDVREAINDKDHEDERDDQTHGGKRRRSTKSLENLSSSKEETMTSWEGFNLCLLGLVNELIGLGVKPSFKTVVLKLWSEYLRKMEVAFHDKQGHTLPKLGPNFKQFDARLIYGHICDNAGRKKKNPAGSSKEPSVEDVDDPNDETFKRKINLKRKQTAFKKGYEKMIHELSSTSQTMTDVTLEMLAVSDVDDEPIELQFTAAAERRKLIQWNLESHPGLLIRNKLIILLYLGLLLSDEQVKLSDLLRWISEGHVSYSHLSRLIPDGQLQGGNFVLFAQHQPCTPYEKVIHGAQVVASFIGIKALKVPSMKDLIKHYIKELNLPAQVGLLAERLLDLLPSQSKIPLSLTGALPNYEGKAMAHIIIALKLLFGLDDATEHRNSRIARRINELFASENESLELFVWDDWERFCALRQTAFILFHEPTHFKSKASLSRIQNIGPLMSEWDQVSLATSNGKRAVIVNDIYKGLLKSLQDKGGFVESNAHKLYFPPSLSPYSSYVEVITKAYEEGNVKVESSEWSQAADKLNINMLKKNFKDTSVDYLTHSKEYIEWAQQHGLYVGLHNGAANRSVQNHEKLRKKNLKFYRVKVYLDKVNEMPSSTKHLACKSEVTKSNRNYGCHKPLIFPEVMDSGKKYSPPDIGDMKEAVVKNKTSNVKKTPGRPGRKRPKYVYKDLRKEDEDNMLHTPHTEYWMCHFSVMNNEMSFPKEAWKLPQSFLFLLEECSSLIEMSTLALYLEIIHLEKLHSNLSENLFSSPYKELHKLSKETR